MKLYFYFMDDYTKVEEIQRFTSEEQKSLLSILCDFCLHRWISYVEIFSVADK